MAEPQSRILYCNCAFANVVPKEVKREVLKRLTRSNVRFDAVSDLCEMSARKDPALERLANSGDVKIAACFPRAVRGLFNAAGSPLSDEGATVYNMRTSSAEEVMDGLLNERDDASSEESSE